jgi:hypothetical protein
LGAKGAGAVTTAGSGGVITVVPGGITVGDGPVVVVVVDVVVDGSGSAAGLVRANIKFCWSAMIVASELNRPVRIVTSVLVIFS